MSKVICIPCLNLRLFDFDYIIHRHSRGKCFSCGATRQGLLISINDFETKCTHAMGCSDVKIKYVCKKETCDA